MEIYVTIYYTHAPNAAHLSCYAALTKVVLQQQKYYMEKAYQRFISDV